MRKLKVTFVGLGTEQLGVSQLSAIAKLHGHQVGLAFSASLFHDRFNLEFPSISPFFDDTAETIAAIRDQRPDVLAFSALTSTYQWMLEVAAKAKEMDPNVRTVFGGVHPSAVPERVLARPQVDFVVIGEGDDAFPRILSMVADGKYGDPIFNTRYKMPDGRVVSGMQKGFLQHLDSLPFYDKPLWEDHVRIGDLYLTMASRGCPYRCTFCFNNFFAKLPEEKSGKYVRLRSVEHMIAELKIAKRRYRPHIIDFQDDVFTTSKKWLKPFTEAYRKEIGTPYNILTHPRYFDEEVATWLKESGCQWVQMGVQSLDEDFKKDNLMRYEKSDHVSSALHLMHTHGLHAKVDHMFGLPNEPVEAQELARELYSTHHPKRIQTFWTCYLPGTAMMKEAEDNGSLSKEQAEKINEGEDFYFFRNTDNISDPKLMARYQAYEVLFRVMPALPESWKARFRVHHFERLPHFLIRPLSLLADILSGFKQRNPEFSAYAWHNLYHLWKFTGRKLGFKVGKASKVFEDVAFDVPMDIKEPEAEPVTNDVAA
jgi:anaerobic magnesium-protoporphyrin IX monomethyl ester cyclase